MQHVIQVEERNSRGKGAARKQRAAGHIPGVLYGHKEVPIALTIDPRVISKRLRTSGMGRNTVFELAGLSRPVLCLLKDAQLHPLRRSLMHVDLVEVREDDDVNVNVPLLLTGKPVGVTAGGELQVIRRDVHVIAKPLAIPKSITLDITSVALGVTLHIEDITYPEGTRAADAGRLAILSVKAPREAKDSDAAVAEVGEAPAAE